MSKVVLFAIAMLSTAAGANAQGALKFAIGAYDVTGTYDTGNGAPVAIAGTGAIGSSGASGTHTATTPSSWGTDDLTWDKTKGAYQITDGDSGAFIAYLFVESVDATGKIYTCRFENAAGTNVGSETWKKQ